MSNLRYISHRVVLLDPSSSIIVQNIRHLCGATTGTIKKNLHALRSDVNLGISLDFAKREYYLRRSPLLLLGDRETSSCLGLVSVIWSCPFLSLVTLGHRYPLPSTLAGSSTLHFLPTVYARASPSGLIEGIGGHWFSCQEFPELSDFSHSTSFGRGIPEAFRARLTLLPW